MGVEIIDHQMHLLGIPIAPLQELADEMDKISLLAVPRDLHLPPSRQGFNRDKQVIPILQVRATDDIKRMLSVVVPMAGVYKLDIAERVEDLKQLLGRQKSALDKERVQLLYLLKSGQAKTVQAAAELLGRHRVTVQEWLVLCHSLILG